MARTKNMLTRNGDGSTEPDTSEEAPPPKRHKSTPVEEEEELSENSESDAQSDGSEFTNNNNKKKVDRKPSLDRQKLPTKKGRGRPRKDQPSSKPAVGQKRGRPPKKKSTSRRDMEDDEDDLSSNGGMSAPLFSPPPSAAIKPRKKASKQVNEYDHAPKDIFDDIWTERHERTLRSQWSRENDLILDATCEAEVSLWKKSYQMFGLAPMDLLPEGIHVDLSLNNAIADPENTNLEDDQGLENPNWPQDFCVAFSQVVCCEAFKDRLDFLHYVLKYALHVRLGSANGFKKPNSSRLAIQRNNKILVEFSRLADSNAIAEFNKISGEPIEEILKLALNTSIGTDEPPHKIFFADWMQDAGGLKYFQEQKGLIKRDLVNIITAWDTYAAKSKSRLCTMADYAKLWNDEHTKASHTLTGSQKYHTADIFALKKEWILRGRRIATKNSIQQTLADSIPQSSVQQT
jgi:hypothetical protein